MNKEEVPLYGHKTPVDFIGPHHFPGLLGEVEGVGQDVDVGGPLQFVSAVGGDVELDVIPLQQGHLGLGVLLPKRKLFVGEANAGGDSAGQRVVLRHQKQDIRQLPSKFPGDAFDWVEHDLPDSLWGPWG